MKRLKIAFLFLIFFFTIESIVISIDIERSDICFFNVGEGEAFLLSSNGEYMLIDTGNLLSGNLLLSYLRLHKIKLKGLIITHPHPDHMGGIFFLKKNIPIENIYDNGQPISSNPQCDIYRWYKELIRHCPNYRVLHRGDHISVGAVTLYVLWPPKERYGKDWNDNSLVLLAIFPSFKVLFTSDISKKVEERLIKLDGTRLKANILKIAHHGADNATSLSFLQTVSPSHAIISINKNNIRGYPSSKVIERLKRLSIKVYKTYESGNIFVISTKTGFKIHPSL